jgi:ubiquinone/menaquinone biosynthesis C-methylase UbiE
MLNFRKIFATIYPENSLDTDLKYKPVATFLKKKLRENPKILEVGSGTAGITRYLNFPITGVDINFEKSSKLVNQVKIKGVKLPFKDNSFDYVISVDMIEHLPHCERKKAIKEMVRVATKGLILTVPCEVKAQDQDKQLFDYYLKNYRKEEKMLKEHLNYGLPKTMEIQKLIKNSGKEISVKTIPNVNLWLRSFYMKSFFSTSPWFRKVFWLLLPLDNIGGFLNFGNCYRQIFFVTLK